MSDGLTLVFIHGSWHRPICYDKVIKLLRDEHGIECIAVALPSTSNNPDATFKDDLDAARDAVLSQTTKGRDVIVVAHSYGGIVGGSCIKGLTLPKTSLATRGTSTEQLSAPDMQSSLPKQGYVVALVLIASGFAMTGWSFMDPFFGRPPPAWRVDKETGYATLVADPQQLFYHDVPDDEAKYWVSQLTTQSLKALFEGGEYVYSGWWDVPTWYIGTADDKALPIVVQRIQVGTVRAQGAEVHYFELKSGHSPFLSMQAEVVEVLLETVRTAGRKQALVDAPGGDVAQHVQRTKQRSHEKPMVQLVAPSTWIRFGLPFLVGRMIGWGLVGFGTIRSIWRR